MAHDRGQSTVEWLGIVLALAGLIFTGAAISQAPFVARAVDRQIQRAYCVMRHGDCERDRLPCVVASSQRSTGLTVRLLVAELGGGKLALIEHLSDGTVKVTATTRAAVSTKLGFGVGGSVGDRGKGIALGADLSHAIAASADGGRSWVAANGAQASELVARLRLGYSMPEPDITYNRLGMNRDSRISLKAKRGKAQLAGGGALGVERGAGVERNRRTGVETLRFTGAAHRSAKLTVFGRTLADSGSEVKAGEHYAIERDAAGRLLDLAVTTTSDRLPEAALGFGGVIDADRGQKERAYEMTAHLDLTEPASRAAAVKLVAALRNPSPERLTEAAGRVRALVKERGVLEVHAYEQRSSNREIGVTVNVIKGVKAGAGYETGNRSAELVAAATRDPAGNWLPRDDCVSRARSGT